MATIVVYADSFSRRIRVDDYGGNIIEVIKLLAANTPEWADKVIVKSRTHDVPLFISGGFLVEAFIKGYYNGADMYFVVKYSTSQRQFNFSGFKEQVLLERIFSDGSRQQVIDTNDVQTATENDAEELADLYGHIFEVYPTALREMDYVKKTMQEGTKYVFIRHNEKLVSAASAEVNRQFSNAELTDCATLPLMEGRGHIRKLLTKLEDDLRRGNITCLYSIARSASIGMNKALFQLGYTYGGRMTNNCKIFTGLEDMNVWYKY